MIMQLPQKKNTDFFNEIIFMFPGSVYYREHHIPVPDSDVARRLGDVWSESAWSLMPSY